MKRKSGYLGRKTLLLHVNTHLLLKYNAAAQLEAQK